MFYYVESTFPLFIQKCVRSKGILSVEVLSNLSPADTTLGKSGLSSERQKNLQKLVIRHRLKPFKPYVSESAASSQLYEGPFYSSCCVANCYSWLRMFEASNSLVWT